MAWKIEFEPPAQAAFAKLDAPIRKRIFKFLDERVKFTANPRSWGESLRGSELGKFWKYRIGDYRLICHIEDETVTITIVKLGHRREIYRQH